jgi:hypothetical protein
MPDFVAIVEWTPCVLDLIHVANVLYLISYLVRDILWLRVLTVVAILTLMPYYFSCSQTPLWAAIVWQGVFGLVNSFQIFLLVKERWPRDLQGAERQLYDTVFKDLTPGEFVKLLGVGNWHEADEGEILVEDGTVVHNMMVLTDGAMIVRKGDKELARLKPGQFVGEMSFLSGNKAGADVVAGGTANLMSWEQEALEKFLEKNPSISFKVRGVLGRDVVAKLAAQ